jgi:hypothetical protein
MSEAPRPVEVTVVAPVFNERENLKPLVDELIAVLRPSRHSFEILLVDDGSRDGSAEEIEALAALHPEVRGLHFRDELRPDGGLRRRLQECARAVVVTIDADLKATLATSRRSCARSRGTMRDRFPRGRATTRSPFLVENRERRPQQAFGDDVIDTEVLGESVPVKRCEESSSGTECTGFYRRWSKSKGGAWCRSP